MNTPLNFALKSLVALLILGSLWAVWHRYSPKPGTGPMSSPMMATVPGSTVNTGVSASTTTVTTGVAGSPQQGQDPFASPFDKAAAGTVHVQPPTPESRVRLEGIIVAVKTGAAQAIVNGRLVSRGAIVNGVLVQSIGHRSVTFEFKGHTFSKSVKKS